jgi:hypothetical protein
MTQDWRAERNGIELGVSAISEARISAFLRAIISEYVPRENMFAFRSVLSGPASLQFRDSPFDCGKNALLA